MALTLRLPTELQNRAAGYATELGISLNALVAVALRDYLDARSKGLAPAAVQPQEASEGSEKATLPVKPSGGGGGPSGGSQALPRAERRRLQREQRKGRV